MTFTDFVDYLRIVKFIEKDDVKFSRLEEANKSFLSHFNINELLTVNSARLKKIVQNERKNIYQTEQENRIGELFTGDQFGDIAIATGNIRRNATIITQEECVFATIDKVDYNKTIKQFKEKQDHILADCLKKQSIFKSWPNFLLFKLIQKITKIKLKQNQVLFEQNQKSIDIFFLVKGHIKLTMVLDINNKKNVANYIIESELNPISSLVKSQVPIPMKDFDEYIYICGKN